MKRCTWMLLLIFLTWQSPAEAHNSCAKAQCAEVKEKIRTIESKMRAGYTYAQGRKYEDKLRELKAKRYKLCR